MHTFLKVLHNSMILYTTCFYTRSLQQSFDEENIDKLTFYHSNFLNYKVMAGLRNSYLSNFYNYNPLKFLSSKLYTTYVCTYN